jgi:hypothetical protein
MGITRIRNRTIFSRALDRGDRESDLATSAADTAAAGSPDLCGTSDRMTGFRKMFEFFIFDVGASAATRIKVLLSAPIEALSSTSVDGSKFEVDRRPLGLAC